MILKLMIVEIKRYLRSLYYLVVLFILFLIHMLGLKGGVPFLFWGDDFFRECKFYLYSSFPFNVSLYL